MKKEDIINSIRDRTNELKKRGVSRLGLFGSYAKNKQKRGSDVDILVEVNDVLSLSELVRIKIALESYLKRRVDLVEYSSLHPLIRKQVLKEEVRII